MKKDTRAPARALALLGILCVHACARDKGPPEPVRRVAHSAQRTGIDTAIPVRERVGSIELVRDDVENRPMSQVPPAQLPEYVRARYLLRPDRRFLLPVARGVR